MVTSSEKVALQVVQQAISALAKWANFAHPPLDNHEFPEVTRAKEILVWKPETKVGILSLVFDSINLSDKPQTQATKHYHPLKAIDNDHKDKEYPDIPYPLNSAPSSEQQQAFKTEINNALSKYLKHNWENLSLLMLILEKFGSCLSFGEADVALVDIARTTAGVAVALLNNPNKEISLIAGDLSGIQKFIYSISSEGALKSLRARSFYLELVTEEVVQQLLEQLKLPRTNIIYAGGGNLYILASGTAENQNIVQKIRQQFNEWLLAEFEGKVFLALDCLKFPVTELKDKFAEHWSKATKDLAVYKSRKFAENQISEFIAPRYSHEPCRVCHRDDVEILKPLNSQEPDSVLACGTCRSMFDLGSQLLEVKAIVRSTNKSVKNALHTLSFKLTSGEIHYHLFKKWKQIDHDSDIVLLVNDWQLEHYQFKHFENAAPLLLGNYGKEGKQNSEIPAEPRGFMRAEEMSEKAQGANRVGYLRMDVDRLGQIFAKGLGEKQTLSRLAGLSRQMSYFFKVYLNTLAAYINLKITDTIKPVKPDEQGLNILFIYAGGDDLFISGAWSEIVEFAFEIYQSFRTYTGNNEHITLSGGISIDDIKFPLYQAAKLSKIAEDAAKDNGRDSLGLFGEVFKWDEWRGRQNFKHLDDDVKNYLHSEKLPSLFGVYPFVERLEQQDIGVNYSRNFVRNLLITAEIQEQALKKFQEDKKSQEALGTRYYLHLPKIAYTLARLPKNVLEDSDFRTSLKNPYNAPYFRAIATWIELLNRSSES
ncbi:type III-A CRISPR-associated protein Cas10/Csm1 [Nodularia sphaerocarpa]|uniref:type III-A CRISPR-associated protein Cas10/Csm1 n=1 Tax=Nodularia sphaerocarpa TaxID=137816 RepID=UPI001EFB3D06|nr:type III-A CRISPR-associated protein Cas10/Csm1 [Nodularia sphaerocarpa]MDB9373418.1 type III-A CRISPR-associated protein Cas10/Csm1 [Nodularia sphaerocarpa CS-585]MDB9378187.1 type III-A CRISPR-associated protein Cas10/Csm1 [Nodularia sphaerocarpa CS-585A2]ULP71412.1 CRISPR-associated protein Cas10/Csm1 [Nodularia sphaerocarpa UHCC 0038]